MTLTSESNETATGIKYKTGIEAAGLREAFGAFASGLTVVTGVDAEGPIGFTCQSFHSVSLEPPLVSIAIMDTSSSYARMRARGRFAVNILAADQQELAQQFARKGIDRWVGVDWTTSALGNPIIRNSPVTIDCQTWKEYDVGDHVMVIGQVNEIHRHDQISDDPLVFYRSCFRSLASE